MQGLNDHDFDALFKKAAEQHRVPYNPSAWEKMRRKLDRASGTLGSSGKIILGVALLLLLGGTLGVSLWYQSPEQDIGTEETTQSEYREDVERSTTPQSPRNQPRQPADQSPQAKDETNSPARNAIVAQDVTKTDSAAVSFEAFVQDLALLDGIGYLRGNPVRDHRLEPGEPSVYPVMIPAKDSSSVEVSPDKSPVPIRLRISFGVSPDISAINLGEASQVGSKAAVGLEYFIAPRLSVQTGVIFSNKVYQATGESYKPYPGYWKKYPVPNSIDARCDVLDIPLNLRYYVVSMPRSRVFVSGGVSSYLMLTEDYVYRYKSYGYQKPPSYEHHERNKNHHYFKVANISLGYERSMGKRWALQVEPFVKLPVAGVGFGKIKLSTTGMFMSLNYRLR